MKATLKSLGIIAFGLLFFISSYFFIEKYKNTPAKYHIHVQDKFYVRWGYPDGIRRYKCIDTNSNGYFVIWLDAGVFDSHSVEFMPNNIVDNDAFKPIN